MKALTIRNVPEPLHRSLCELASRNRRSLQQQVLLLLERAHVLQGASPTVAAAGIRRRLAGRPLGNTVAEVREERAR